MKRVSVLMTVYNTERYLAKSINSILNQKFKNFELIIVDDFSTDESGKILKKFKNNRIKKFFLKKHIGRTPALNFGLKKCKGEFIAILDSDDISLRNRLSMQINYLKKNLNTNMIGTQTILIDSNGKKIRNFFIPKNNEELNRRMIFHNYLPHSSVMFRRKFLKKVGSFYPKNFIYAQDYALILKFLAKSKIYILPNILTKSRVLKTNMTNSKSLKLVREIEMVKNNLYSLKNFKLSLSERIYLYYLIIKRILKYIYFSIF